MLLSYRYWITFSSLLAVLLVFTTSICKADWCYRTIIYDDTSYYYVTGTCPCGVCQSTPYYSHKVTIHEPQCWDWVDCGIYSCHNVDADEVHIIQCDLTYCGGQTCEYLVFEDAITCPICH